MKYARAFTALQNLQKNKTTTKVIPDHLLCIFSQKLPAVKHLPGSKTLVLQKAFLSTQTHKKKIHTAPYFFRKTLTIDALVQAGFFASTDIYLKGMIFINSDNSKPFYHRKSLMLFYGHSRSQLS